MITLPIWLFVLILWLLPPLPIFLYTAYLLENQYWEKPKKLRLFAMCVAWPMVIPLIIILELAAKFGY